MTVFDQIGSLADRLRNRVGRDRGICQTCGSPTRSHNVGDGLQCHSCYTDGCQVLVTDGGDPVKPGETRPDSDPHPSTEVDIGVQIPDGVEIVCEDGKLLARQEPDPDTGVRTDPEEFRRFHKFLVANAPEGYIPHYIKCEKGGKAPAAVRSWKHQDDRLTADEAVEWLLEGGNVGIAGVERDTLLDLDIDDPELVDEGDVKPTLRAVSRSRPTEPGGHAWYFGAEDIPNIDSDAGEVRTDNQYVVAPGSHVPIDLSDPDDPDLEDIPEHDRENVGRYTIADDRPAATLEYDDLPPIYCEEYEERQAVVEARPDHREAPPEPTGDGGERSAIFDLDITDVTGLPWGYRGVNPIGHHSNDRRGNDAYFVLLRDHGVAYDHKDDVAFSPASYALVDAGERNPRAPNGGLSDREYFVFWKYCKDRNLVPAGDPIPNRALVYIALEAGGCDPADVDDGWKLPAEAHNTALEHVRDEFGLDPGRKLLAVDPGGGQYPIKECEPPKYDPEPFNPQQHWEHLQGERYDATLAHDGPVIWADDPGSGKTDNALLAALERDRDVAALFDKHEKAREIQTDAALPDEFDPYHLKGGEQKRDDVCMDADHADEACPTHGNTSACPSMCPVYDRPADDSLREVYEALASEIGDVNAHLALGDELPNHDEDGRCDWYDQFDAVENADHVVGVHEYQTLKTVREGRDVIVDESPRALIESSRFDVEDLIRAANALDALADTLKRTDPARYTALRVAAFVRDLVDELTTDGDAILEEIDAPTPIWNAYETHNDVAGNYVEREEATEPWHYAEALAQLKVAYTGGIVRRIERNGSDEWDGEPVGIDPVLATLAEAGLPTEPIMKAIAVPSTLDECPWCRSPVEGHGGARGCSSDTCGWHEVEALLTTENGAHARALAYADEDTDALAYTALPLKRELPDEPLILDATATPSKVALFYGVDESDVAVFGNEAFEANMRVTQILNGQFHYSTILQSMTDGDGNPLPRDEWGSPADKIQKTIDTGCDLYERPLFGVKEGLIPRFEWPENAVVMHYHAIRGLDREGCDAVFAIGAPHSNIDDLRRTAELLAHGRDDVRVGGEEHSTRPDAPNPPVYRKLNFEDENGRGRAVPTKHYTGLVGELFRETRENELGQFVHRARPLLADDTVDIYLLTNVPTNLRVDEVCDFDELANPLQAMLPVSEGALNLLEAVENARTGDVDGFRTEQLIEKRSDGTLANKVKGYHKLTRATGVTPRGSDGPPAEKTVRNWVHALEEVGLLVPEEYEQRAGVSFAIDSATLQSALQVVSGSAGFKVAAVRRLRQSIETASGSLDWLDWAREVFGLGGDRCVWPNGGDSPPNGLR